MVALVDDARRLVPRTDVILADPRLTLAEERLGRALVRESVHRAQQRAREGLIGPGEVIEDAVAGLPPLAASLTPMINATGVLLAAGLGRAPLSRAARDALVTAAGCNDLEYDLGTGARGKRGAAMLAALARAVPDAGAVHVVNSNAAALVLAATALAPGREIVVSRADVMESGESAGLPELLASTGAAVREVGGAIAATLADYDAAIGPRTGLVLRVHRPGSAVGTGIADLAGLGVLVVGDLGSGLLAPHPALPQEPDAATWLRAGAALVTASGDKLLGGPQAGLLLGRADLIGRLARHPLARALRVGKLTVAALEATLTGPPGVVPAALCADPGERAERAQRLAGVLCAAGLDARQVRTMATVGEGADVRLASTAVSLPEALAGPLRAGEPVRTGKHPAVVGQVTGGRLLLDLLAVPPSLDDALLAAVLTAGSH